MPCSCCPQYQNRIHFCLINNKFMDNFSGGVDTNWLELIFMCFFLVFYCLYTFTILVACEFLCEIVESEIKIWKHSLGLDFTQTHQPTSWKYLNFENWFASGRKLFSSASHKTSLNTHSHSQINEPQMHEKPKKKLDIRVENAPHWNR